MALVRTQIQLRPEQHRRLREEAFRRGVSMSALLRELLDERLDNSPPVDHEAAWAFVGAGRDTANDVSERHDDYLADIIAGDRE